MPNFSTHLPERIVELRALVPHVVVALGVPGDRGTRLVLASETTVVPDTVGSGPITAEGVGEDVEIVVEELVRVAEIRNEGSDGETPGVRVGLLSGDVGGDSVTGEPPDADAVLGPEHCSSAEAHDSLIRAHLQA